MSLESKADGTPVHLPADPAKFAFDREVSAIFPNMAGRSIPNFYQAHAAHARMLADWIRPGVKILDVGASRGAFFDALIKEYPVSWEVGELKLTAIDNSPDMCGYLKTDFPGIEVRCQDITQLDTRDQRGTFDVVCAHYVLQFLPTHLQVATMLRLFSLVRPGGVFILGHKSAHGGASGEAAHREYINFRVKNGYSREEIEAKTAALKGSMFPMEHNYTMTLLRTHFSEVTETYRFMMFSTLFAVK